MSARPAEVDARVLALVIDGDCLARNLARMRWDVEAAGKQPRRHIEAHKVPEVARRQRKNVDLLTGADDDRVLCHAIFGRMLSGEANGA